MTKTCIQFHTGIAEKHGKFIKILQQCAESFGESTDSSDIFCMWLVVASYYRAIHLLEALFISKGELAALSVDPDVCCIDSRRKAERRRERLLKTHIIPRAQQAFKSLQRLAFYVENLPNCGVVDIDPDYDVVTEFARTKLIVVEGYLKTIEEAILPELIAE